MVFEYAHERIAVLIDAENAQASKIEGILRDVSAYGRIVIKRAYANWSKPNLKSWEDQIKRFAIGTIQQFDFAAGKNASDMALTIDAMDMLNVGKYDCFVIVSSDSDFTTLAIKLHESGAYVIGYGNKQTVESFRSACDEFNYVENVGSKSISLNDVYDVDGSDSIKSDDIESSEVNDRISEQVLDELLHMAEDKYSEVDGYVNVSSAGAYIKRVRSDFNIMDLGYAKLPEYLKAKSNKYDVVERKGKGTVKLILYRSKD